MQKIREPGVGAVWENCSGSRFFVIEEVTIDFPLGVKFILRLEGGVIYAYHWRVFKYMQSIYKDA